MTPRTLGMLAVGTVGLLALPACKKDEAVAPAAVAASPTPEAGKAPEAAPPQAQAVPDTTARGSIQGTVAFTGTPPVGAAITPSADPSCAGMPLQEEAVLVKDGRLRNVLVRVRGPVAGAPAAAPATPVVIDQTQCTYQPRVQGAVAGQPLRVRNSDGTLHNVRGLSNGKPVFNVAQPPAATPVQRPMPEGVEVLRLKCDVHPWMAAAIIVSPHPYFATTGEEGAFSLEGVPVGTYTLEAWHETLGVKTAEVTVAEGAPARVEFSFDSAAGSAGK